MQQFVLLALKTHPQRWMAAVAAVCFAMLAFGLYLQHSLGLNPCPMCIVQRYALISIAITAGISCATGRKRLQISAALLIGVASVFGAFVAARQSWLQWFPPEIATCGRDFYGMIEDLPLNRAIPMIFKGSGDCAAVDWTFLGGSIANWSFLCFVLLACYTVIFVKQR